MVATSYKDDKDYQQHSGDDSSSRDESYQEKVSAARTKRRRKSADTDTILTAKKRSKRSDLPTNELLSFTYEPSLDLCNPLASPGPVDLHVPRNKKSFSNSEALQLLRQCETQKEHATAVLSCARVLAERAGLTVDSSIVNPAYQTALISANASATTGPQPKHLGDVTTKTLSESATRQTQLYGRMRGGLNCFPLILETTNGHSNTDHIVAYTADEKVDKLAEYKRALQRRARAMRPEDKGEQRWDQPRVKGSRRRRILRQKDLPCAPPEPPTSGYILFVAQMTTKLRHDRPNVQHNQIQAVGEISKIWKYDMSEAERDYYVRFAREAREEYTYQLQEFRATGSYTHSQRFCKLLGDGPFVRLIWEEKNELERELATYTEIIRPGTIVVKADNEEEDQMGSKGDGEDEVGDDEEYVDDDDNF